MLFSEIGPGPFTYRKLTSIKKCWLRLGCANLRRLIWVGSFYRCFVETMDSGERGMNPVAMAIINPRKEILAELGIERATTCSQVLYTTNWAMRAQ